MYSYGVVIRELCYSKDNLKSMFVIFKLAKNLFKLVTIVSL